MKTKLIPFLLLLTCSYSASCYEVDTHRELSRQAALASNLASRLPDFGIDSLNSMLRSHTYHNADPHDRILYCFQGGASRQRSVLDLIRLGAFCEDTTFGTQYPRYTRHFYDPAHNGRGFGGGLFMSSRVWGLEHQNILGQDFSYKDARSYFYSGLTAPSQSDREANLEKTFRTIGHVIHLVQDLGQPQHTRDDYHGDGSLYEGYTNEILASLPFGGYPVVKFAEPGHIWETLDLKGLANFSNMNFVSKGTNFDKPELYYLPRFDIAKRTTMRIEDLCANREPACPNPNLTGVMTFYGNDVVDNYLGTTTRNPYASTNSMFSEDLQKIGLTPAFTLNRFNFELAHTFLIPRSVAYSAGLINYFFRGQIDFVADPANPGKYVIKNLGSETMKGNFTLYYDAADGTRRPVPGATWNDLTISALNNADGASNQSQPLAFTPPTAPAPRAAGEYMLVFHGDMGEETRSSDSFGAVVAKKIDAKGALLIAKYISSGHLSVFRSIDLGKSWTSAGAVGSYPFNFVGDNTVLAPADISSDGGLTWYGLSADSLLRAYRGLSAPAGDTRLIGLAGNGATTGVPMAYSSDKGITWTSAGVAPTLQGIVRRPTYIGNTELVVNAQRYIGKTPCFWSPSQLCDTYAPGIFHSNDNGATWSLMGSDGGIGNDLLYIGKNKWVNGILTPDENGTPTLFSTRVSGRAPSRRIEFVISTDHGASWTPVGYPPGMEFVAPRWPDPWHWTYAGNKTIFAYFHDQAWPSSDALYVSTDNGTTWSLAGNLPPGTAYYGIYGMTYVGNNKAVLGLP